MRCPDCIDGPIPGCQWDYDHPTEWKMKECPTCDGTGKVSVAEVHDEQPKKPSIFESAANKPDPEDYPLANVVQRVGLNRVDRLDVRDYVDCLVADGDLVYCDPPYGETTAYDATGGFDSKNFWSWCSRAAKNGAIVPNRGGCCVGKATKDHGIKKQGEV